MKGLPDFLPATQFFLFHIYSCFPGTRQNAAFSMQRISSLSANFISVAASLWLATRHMALPEAQGLFPAPADCN